MSPPLTTPLRQAIAWNHPLRKVFAEAGDLLKERMTNDVGV